MRVQEFMLDNTDGPSSLAASICTAVDLLESRIEAATTNGIRWVFCSALVAIVSHLTELMSKLELLMFGRNADLTEDEVDALWTRVRAASDSLASYVPSSITCSPPNGVGE
jgi:hypothetical protein